VTLLFRTGECSEASGRLTAVIASPLPGLQLSGLTGSVRCDGPRARVTMASPSGNERVEFYVQGTGRYRGWLSVRNAPPAVAMGLGLLGFRPAPEGLMLSVAGQL
jgi:hypothetical protein